MKIRRQHRRFKRHFVSQPAAQVIEQIAHAIVTNNPDFSRKIEHMSNRRLGATVKAALLHHRKAVLRA